MRKFLIIIFMSLIASSSYYGLIPKKEEQEKDFQNTVQETIQENLVQNETIEDTPKDITNESENIVEQKEGLETKKVIQENTKQNEKSKDTNINNKSEIQETKQKNNEPNKTTATNTKQTEPNNQNNAQTTSPKENQNTKKVDLSKYMYYEKASDGSYKAFMVDKSELNNLKALIDNVINKFGYKNIKVIPDSSLVKDGTRYFTANTTNVENEVYDSEGFNIYYYAVKEYLISPNGTERYFQTRSYIKVK